MEKQIQAWHEKANKHPLMIDAGLAQELAIADEDGQTRLEAMQLLNKSRNGEIVINLKYMSAFTGRSQMDGVNVQGFKKDGGGRKCIVPHEGNVFVGVDSSGIEPRILSWLSGDNFLNFFKNGEDPYVWFSKYIGQERSVAKTAFIALMYGLGKRGLAENLKAAGVDFLSDSQVAVIHSKFIDAFPKITGGKFKKDGFWQKTFNDALATGRLTLPSGRTLEYKIEQDGLDDFGRAKYAYIDSFGRNLFWFGKAVNNLVQATARNVFFWQVSKMVEALDGIADICFTVHDEVLFECQEEVSEVVAKVLGKFAAASPEWCPHENLFCGKVKIGRNYGEMEKR